MTFRIQYRSIVYGGSKVTQDIGCIHGGGDTEGVAMGVS